MSELLEMLENEPAKKPAKLPTKPKASKAKAPAKKPAKKPEAKQTIKKTIAPVIEQESDHVQDFLNQAAKQAVIVVATYRTCSGVRRDRDASDAARNSQNAKGKSVKASKWLFPDVKGEKNTLNDLLGIVAKARQCIERHTLPFGESGERFISVNGLESLKKDLESINQELEQAKQDFVNGVWSSNDQRMINTFADRLDAAKIALGDSFDPKESMYQNPQRLLNAFSFGISVRPVPLSQALNLPVSKEALNGMKESIKNDSFAAFEAGQSALVESLLQSINGLLRDKNGNARDSNYRSGGIKTLETMCDRLASMNLFGNESIISAIQAIRATCAMGSETLNKDESARELAQAALKEAEETLKNDSKIKLSL